MHACRFDGLKTSGGLLMEGVGGIGCSGYEPTHLEYFTFTTQSLRIYVNVYGGEDGQNLGRAG